MAGCRGTAIASTPYLPPKAVVVIVQHYGSRVFVVVAAAAVLMALAMAALFVRMRVRRAPAPAGPPHRPIPARAGAQIAGAAGAGMRRSEELTSRAMRAGGALVEWGRSAAPPDLAAARAAAGPRLGGSLLPVGALGFRARVRRFVYTHQDALWVALVAALVATMVLILLIAA